MNDSITHRIEYLRNQELQLIENEVDIKTQIKEIHKELDILKEKEKIQYAWSRSYDSRR